MPSLPRRGHAAAAKKNRLRLILCVTCVDRYNFRSPPYRQRPQSQASSSYPAGANPCSITFNYTIFFVSSRKEVTAITLRTRCQRSWTSCSTQSSPGGHLMGSRATLLTREQSTPRCSSPVGVRSEYPSRGKRTEQGLGRERGMVVGHDSYRDYSRTGGMTLDWSTTTHIVGISQDDQNSQQKDPRQQTGTGGSLSRRSQQHSRTEICTITHVSCVPTSNAGFLPPSSPPTLYGGLQRKQ